ncbi:MAG: 2-oxo acid dehydrogenase subunit E2, partial [Nitrospirales bacterium]
EGVFAFHPLLNQGQSAILGVGGEFFPPGSREGVFNLILAFDHQVSEGRQAAKFLRELGDHLQAYEAALAGPISKDQGAEDVEKLSCARCLTPLGNIQEWDKFDHWDHFMVPMVKPNGQHGYLCSVCIRGW